MTVVVRRICSASDLAESGTGIRFRVVKDGEARPAFAVRFGGRVFAYLNACAHRAVELDWVPGEFFDAERQHLICATHGARYEPATGRCVAGPCGKLGLVPLAVREENGKVYLVHTDDIDLCEDS